MFMLVFRMADYCSFVCFCFDFVCFVFFSRGGLVKQNWKLYTKFSSSMKDYAI